MMIDYNTLLCSKSLTGTEECRMILGLDPQSRFSDIDTESLSAILFLLQQGPNVNFRTSLIHTPIVPLLLCYHNADMCLLVRK